MNDLFQQFVLNATGARQLFKIKDIQSLWSGYGSIGRYRLSGADHESIVVKHVTPPNQPSHPRGWNTPFSHQRKIKSYRVESAWYQHYSQRCDERCTVPQCLGLQTNDNEFLMVLEDLHSSGFPVQKDSVTLREMYPCLTWLAQFHATFMGQAPLELWKVGTYWHLSTRPDELEALNDEKLKSAALAIDLRLQQCPYQTLVHGDAKLANFCFSENGQQVAAVDFQYVGGGCGMKDVAYFIGSCLNEDDCDQHAQPLLDFYFQQLKIALVARKVPVDPQLVEQDWRAMFPLAWTDFHRFLKGWSPDHWKLHGYSERLAHQVVANIHLQT